MKKILSTAAVLSVAAVAVLALTAFRGPHDHARFERFVGHRVDDLLDDVHATDAQRQQIQAIRDKVVADAKAMHASQGGARQELLAQWQADQPDAAKVHALVEARAAAMKSLADEVTDAVIQVHGILTPDQRAVITKKLQRHLQE